MILDDRSRDALFREARRGVTWLDRPVSSAIIEAIWDLARALPGAVPGSPRVVLLASPAGRARLAECGLALAAPVVAVIGAGAPADADAQREAALRAGYLVLAARALGLEAEPFLPTAPAALDRAFFAAGEARTTLLLGLGYGEPRSGRPEATADFAAACRLL